jgi:hypothetical protein
MWWPCDGFRLEKMRLVKKENLMRYLCLLMMFVVCCSTFLSGVEPAEVERIRKEEIANSKKLKYSPELLTWYVSRISNDNEPFTDEEVFQVFAKPASNESERFRHMAYIDVALFRWRDRGDVLLRLFDVLTPDERSYMCSLWKSLYKSFLTPQSFPVWERMFLERFSLMKDDRIPVDKWEGTFHIIQEYLEKALELDRKQAVAVFIPQCFPVLKRKLSENISAMSDSAVSHDQRDAALRKAQSWLWLALMLDPEQAVALAEAELKWHVSDELIRANLVYTLLDGGGRHALPLAEWYFKTYCSSPFDVSILLEYLKKHVPEDELKQMVKNRRDDLQETVDILDGKETRTTKPERLIPDTTKGKK